MTFRKYVMIGMVLFCGSALLLGCSDDDPAAPTTGNEAPPAVVSGLTISMISANEVQLIWDASTQPNLGGYHVYRHIESEHAIGRLTTSPISQNRYLDGNITKGLVYEYFVTAVTTKGAESALVGIKIDTDLPGDKNDRRYQD